MNTIFHLSSIKDFALQLWKENNQHKIWAFAASMGSGKTTLIHALCNVLHVKDAVTSPTFAIINEYYSPSAGIIYHMDWYRLHTEKEAIQAGCGDCIERGNLCLIEWPERIPSLLPSGVLHIKLEIINEQERRLTVND